jgi:hypothetical protein
MIKEKMKRLRMKVRASKCQQLPILKKKTIKKKKRLILQVLLFKKTRTQKVENLKFKLNRKRLRKKVDLKRKKRKWLKSNFHKHLT